MSEINETEDAFEKFLQKNKPFRAETDTVSNSERLLLLFFRFELFSPS